MRLKKRHASPGQTFYFLHCSILRVHEDVFSQHLENWIEEDEKSKATEGMHASVRVYEFKKANCGKL